MRRPWGCGKHVFAGSGQMTLGKTDSGQSHQAPGRSRPSTAGRAASHPRLLSGTHRTSRWAARPPASSRNSLQTLNTALPLTLITEQQENAVAIKAAGTEHVNRSRTRQHMCCSWLFSHGSTRGLCPPQWAPSPVESVPQTRLQDTRSEDGPDVYKTVSFHFQKPLPHTSQSHHFANEIDAHRSSVAVLRSLLISLEAWSSSPLPTLFFP